MAEPVIHRGSARWSHDQTFVGTDNNTRAIVFDTDNDGRVQQGHQPYQIFLAATAACTCMDVVMVLGKKRQPLKGLTVEVRGTKAEEYPRRYLAIHVIYTLRGAVEREAADRAIELSMTKYCPALATFRAAGATITHELHIEPAD